jgi:O-antigen ligase
MVEPVGYCRIHMSSTAAQVGRPAINVPLAALLALGVLGGIVIPFVGLMLPLLLILGCTALWLTVKAPGGIFGLYLTIPFYKGAVQAYSPIDITFALAMLIMLQVIPIILRRKTGSISRTGLLLWATLALLVLAGVLWAPDQSLALGHAGTFWLLVALPLAVGAWRVGSDPRYVRQLLWTLFALGVLTTILGIHGVSSVDTLVVLGANTISVSLAALLVPLLGLTFVGRHRTWRVRLGLIALSIAAFFVALATGSRGPLLVLIAVGFLGMLNYFAHPRSVDWPRTAVVTAIVCAGILAVSFLSPLLPAYATGRFAVFGDFVSGALSGDLGGTSAVDTSSTARVGLYGVATTMFEERPVLGFGTSGFEAMSNQFLGYTEAYPHDAVLQFAAEYGLVGATLFICLMIVGLVRRLPEYGRPVKILLIYFLLEALFSGDIFQDRTTWGLLLVIFLIQVPITIRAGSDEPMQPTSRQLPLAKDGSVA